MSGAKATRFTRSGRQLADPQVHTVVNAMSFEGKQRAPVLSASFRTIIGLSMLLTLSSAMFAHANSEAPNSAAYQEVTAPLDPETRGGGTLCPTLRGLPRRQYGARAAALRAGKRLAQYLTLGHD